MATPRQLINYANAEMKMPQWSAASFTTTTGMAYSQLQALNYLLRELDQRDPKWGSRQTSYELSTVADQANYDLPTLQSDLYPSRVTQVRHADNYPIHKITHKQYEEHALPASNYEQVSVSTGEPKFWYEYNEQMYLVEDIPNSVQTITIFYRTSLTTPLTNTSTDLDSATAITYPEKDTNMLVAGLKWKTAEILREEEEVISRYKYEYELAVMRSSIDEGLGEPQMDLDPYWAAMMDSNPYSGGTE